MSDERFDYARKQIDDGIQAAAANMAWLICREMGKHTGNDRYAELRREELQLSIESFLRS